MPLTKKDGEKVMWNTELISSITLGAAATVPLIVAIVQIVKMTQWIPDKFSPFVAIGAGILISFLLAHDQRDFSANILAGILFGLAASGLYSGVKSTSSAIQAERSKKHNVNNKNKY
jgi:peptidoglycan/LPS O-acetylase OafA/YrhL